MERKIVSEINYVKRKYVMGTLYVLSSVSFSVDGLNIILFS